MFSPTPFPRAVFLAQVRSKIAMFCHVEPKHVLSVHDCSSIYRVPLLLESQGVFQICKDVIGMNTIDTTPFDHESDVYGHFDIILDDLSPLCFSSIPPRTRRGTKSPHTRREIIYQLLVHIGC